MVKTTNMQKTQTIQNLPSYLGLKDVLIGIKPALSNDQIETIVDLGTVQIVSMSAVIELASMYNIYRNRIKFLNAKQDIESMLKAAIVSSGSDKASRSEEVNTKDKSI